VTTAPPPNPAAPPPPGRLDLAAQHLPCGADIDDLLDQVAADQATTHTRHQAECPSCQAALAELAALWSPVADLVNTPIHTPDGLPAAVMRHIHRLAHDVWYTLQLTDHGAIRVAARTVAAIARRAALRVPGVRVALGRSTLGPAADRADIATHKHHHPHAAVGVLGRTAVVDLALAVSYGQPINHIARQVQHRVVTELHDQVGLHRAAVNITIDDVLPPPDEPTTRRHRYHR
jgi:uncharacterized alkaline shock family protein YloU